jgi:hypothetical protein
VRTVFGLLVLLIMASVPGLGRAAGVPPTQAGDMAAPGRAGELPGAAGVAPAPVPVPATDADSARAVPRHPAPPDPGGVVTTRFASADSARTVVHRAAKPDSAETAPIGPVVPWHRRPRYIMLRSVMFPGWGQWANRRPVKAAVVAAGEGYLLWRAVDYGRQERAKFAEARAAVDPLELARLDGQHRVLAAHRRDFTWWSVFAGLLSMGDAYVDAQLGNFEAEFKPQDTGALGGDGPGWRAAVTLRW